MFTFPVAHFGGGVGFTIDQAIRFNDDDSAYLSRTPGSAGNRRTFTFSCWVKRANITSANAPIFSAGGDDWLMFLSANTLGFNTDGTGNYRIVTSQVFRDPSAWFHLVLRVDTTNSTAGDRLRLYINGSEITSFGTDTNPTLNLDTAFNNTGEHNIGKLVGASQYFDGYLAEIHHVDASSLGPDTFGELNSDGVWIPKKPSNLSYGTTGFHVNGADSSDLGADQVGSNDWTSNALATTDQMPDTPTLNHWTLNPLDSGGTLANGNLQNKGGSSTNTHAPAFPKTGKWYVEIDCIDINTGTTGAHFFGICDASVPFSASFSDHAATSAGQERGGQLQKNNSNTSSGTAVNDGDVIALAFDADNLTLDLYVNNSASGSQITGLTDVQYKLWIQDGGAVTNMQFNFAEASFEYTPPSGFKALSTANLPTSITDGSKYFQATLYAGNGSTQSITNGGNSDLQPDFVWIKNRSATDSHVLTDSVRGATKILATNSTGAESTDADTVTAFNSDGFALGADVKVNTSSENYVAWQWKADSAWSESASGNILASSGRRNTTAGFSIASWTHRTSANYAIKHGLSTTPEFFMTKSRDSGTNWDCWHKDLGDTAKRLIMTTSAEITAYWVDASDSDDGSGSYGDISSGESPVTASLFGFQHDNFSATDDIIGYFFHGVDGHSSFGSYTGNGSTGTGGVFVYTGFTPAMVILKRTNSAQEWQIYDNQRSPTNVMSKLLKPNDSAAEVDNSPGDNEISFLSNGFQLNEDNGGMNASGSSYIFAAWAELPFGGAGAAPATAR